MRGASLHPAERCFLDSQNQRENDGLSAGNLSDDIKVSLSISFLPLFSLFSTIWMAAELCNHWTKWTLEMLPHLKGWFISYYSSHFTGEDRATAVSGPALPITCHPNTLMVSLLVSDYTYILESFLLLPVAALHFHTAACILPTMCLGMTVLISINYGHVDGPGHKMDWSSTLQLHDNESH